MEDCVACGCCVKVCPKQAIEIWKGISAKINLDVCVGCGKCAKECPASVIQIQEVSIWKSIGMTIFGFSLSLIWFLDFSTSFSPGWDFFIPLIISVLKGTKGYCNRYCGRGQLFSILGGRFGLSRKKDIPKWMKSKWFRHGFLIFFFIMFFQMLWNTYLVFAGTKDLRQIVTLLWTFKAPWHWAYHGTLLHPGVAQFAFGFYSVMLTSTILGLITMVLYKPRSWCVYCPMGTMTQMICKLKNKNLPA